MRLSWRSIPWHLVAETGVLLLAASLLFPLQVPVVTLAALGGLVLVWGLALLRKPHAMPVTSLNGAMLAWAIMVGVGIAVTSHPDRTLSKATGLLLGLAIWRYVILFVDRPSRLRWAWAGLAGLGVILIVVGALGTQWSSKIPYVQPLVAWLPSSLVMLPEAPELGINANQLAGVLAFFLPLTLGALLPRGSSSRHGGVSLPVVLAAGSALVVLTVLLVLTQSRSGWAGAVLGSAVVIVVVAWTRKTRGWRLVGWSTVTCVSVLAVLVFFWIGQRSLSALLQAPEGLASGLGTLSLSGRVEIWTRALYAIQDFSLTGCGLGSFREIVWALYPLFRVPPGWDIAHAHNIFLQVAVDVGIPGLVAYLALLILALGAGLRVAKEQARALPGASYRAASLVGALVGLHIYGLADALAPGSRPALVYWVVLGLLAALDRIYGQAPSSASGTSVTAV